MTAHCNYSYVNNVIADDACISIICSLLMENAMLITLPLLTVKNRRQQLCSSHIDTEIDADAVAKATFLLFKQK